MRAALADAAARERIRSDLEATLIVEAAAGTGKTTELVARIVALIRSGRTTLCAGRLCQTHATGALGPVVARDSRVSSGPAGQ